LTEGCLSPIDKGGIHGELEPIALSFRRKHMALQDPVAVYDAANDVEAQLICNFLNEAGVEAYITEDDAQVGQVMKPQVWVDRSAIDSAKPILQDYERRQQREGMAQADDAVVESVCEECGQRTAFSASQEGTVQTCPHCGSCMDVGEVLDSK
jgi:hypothetical protein